MTSSVGEFLDLLPRSIDPAMSANVSAVFQFVEERNDGVAVWSVTIADGAVDVARGRGANSDIALTASREAWSAMLSGELDAREAILIGKLKLEGDVTLVMQLQRIFRL
ncbi:MAG TPA: SCP2 sterol-binding domain-containing protein [Candidatus Hydrogenedentes bacterium]|nr:SCP2 sterol-binding domain-containing protein [Candidatus Hydrogenedentota bacterium]